MEKKGGYILCCGETEASKAQGVALRQPWRLWESKLSAPPKASLPPACL